MYVIKPHPAAVTLFSTSGQRRSFASKAECVKALGYDWIAKNVGDHFREFSHRVYITSGAHNFYYGKAIYVVKEYILRDDEGKVLSLDDFYALRPRKHYHFSRPNALIGWNGIGPVPYTGKRTPYRCFLRHPGTHALRRDAQDLGDYGEPPVRGKRSMKSLPTYWDDILRSDCCNHSWKSNRKTQWK